MFQKFGIIPEYPVIPPQTYLKRNVFWPDVEDYIGLSLATAHEVNPDAVLGVNDYKFESKAGYGTRGQNQSKSFGFS